MPSHSPLRAGGDPLRWTPAWVLTISFLTPASAWALHSVMPDLVAWYVGIMGWLILTPEKGMRLRLAHTATESSAKSVGQVPVRSENAVPVNPAAESTESSAVGDSASADANATKAKKPRSRARKPKAMTLAEVKALTSSADRAVVWSQVGPGKFVRNPGEDSGEQAMDSDAGASNSVPGSPQVIETTARNSAVLNDDEADGSDEYDQA